MTRRHKVRRAPRHGRDERGATIILFALTLVVLLIFTAFAVDFGAARQRKRQVQSTADAGSLGAAQDFQLGSDALVVSEVRSLIEQNLELTSGTITDTDLRSCGTPSAPTTVIVGGFNCITTNSSFSMLQVRVPRRVYKTYFAGVIGVKTLSVRGQATAQVDTKGFGGVLPFGLAAGGGGGDGYECLKTQSNGTTTDICEGPDQGNFGYLNFGFYATSQCSGDGKPRMPSNIAIGVDHPLSRLNGPPWNGAPNEDNCPPPVKAPNGTDTLTGNVASYFDCGILRGVCGSASPIDGDTGRLARTLTGGGNLVTVSGQPIDNVPLWAYIADGTPSDVPSACWRNQFVGSRSASDSDPLLGGTNITDVLARTYIMGISSLKDRMRTMLQRCFSLYNTGNWFFPGGSESSTKGTGVVFGRNSDTNDKPDLYDIQYSPRFAYVPQLMPGDDPQGNTIVHFQAFRPVFLQRLLSACPSSGCNVDYEPTGGLNFSSGSGSKNVMSNANTIAITSFVFSSGMLPGHLGDPEAPFDIGTNKFVTLVD